MDDRMWRAHCIYVDISNSEQSLSNWLISHGFVVNKDVADILGFALSNHGNFGYSGVDDESVDLFDEACCALAFRIQETIASEFHHE